MTERLNTRTRTRTDAHAHTHAEGSIRGAVLIPHLLKGILVPEDTGPLSWEAQREGITGIPPGVPVTHSSLQKSCAHT